MQKSGSRGTKFPQDLNRYSYAGNNPIGRTDSTGHDWEDFKQYAAGIVEGMGALGGVIASYFDAETWKSVGRGLQLLKNDPGQAWAILREQYYDTPARGFNFLVNNPRDALSILRNNPREAGNILGTVFTGAAFAAYATKVGGCSFSADTVVTTPHGLRPISTLVVGDDVLAYNEVTGRTGSYTITAVLVHLDLTIVHLTLDGESIETTPEHPFFTEAQGWVAAGALQRDDRIRRADGTYGVVQTTSVELHQQPMYNLTVDVAHTFFVGAEQWLVHNTCNPFKGKTPIEIDDMFRKKGFGTSGPDPLNGKGGYINPKSGRSYHIDWKNSYGERPHVDVNRPRTYKGPLEKRKYPIN